jgi:hypothetical protein
MFLQLLVEAFERRDDVRDLTLGDVGVDRVVDETPDGVGEPIAVLRVITCP